MPPLKMNRRRFTHAPCLSFPSTSLHASNVQATITRKTTGRRTASLAVPGSTATAFRAAHARLATATYVKTVREAPLAFGGTKHDSFIREHTTTLRRAGTALSPLPLSNRILRERLRGRQRPARPAGAVAALLFA